MGFNSGFKGLNAMAIYEKKRYFEFFHSEFQTKTVPFLVTPMRAIRCTHFILLQFIIIMLVE